MLISLPTELRLQILEWSIGEHIFHISASNTDKRGKTQLVITLAQCDCCCPLNKRNLLALARTCRLLAAEASEIFYRHTRLAFTSMTAVEAFFEARNEALHFVHSILVRCGPAKHLSRSHKEEKRRVLRLLRTHARHLTNLHVCFSAYYRINQDQNLMSNFWFHNLARFRGLGNFAMSIDLKLLGPIGSISTSNSDQPDIRFKVSREESMLRLLVCRSRAS